MLCFIICFVCSYLLSPTVNLKDTLLPHLPFTINEEKGEEGTAREIFDLIIWNFPHFGGKSRIQKNRQVGF